MLASSAVIRSRPHLELSRTRPRKVYASAAVGFGRPPVALRCPIQLAVHLVAIGFRPEPCACSDVTADPGPMERARVPHKDAHPDVGDVASSRPILIISELTGGRAPS